MPPQIAGWDMLARELDAWSAAGRTAELWWRDDDAVTTTTALDNLLSLGVPMVLSVIPAHASADLSERLQRAPHVVIIQHGWAHTNHAADCERKIELGGARADRLVLDDLSRGHRRLRELIPLERLLPVLAPPWNRIADAIVPMLPPLGFSGLSRWRPRVHEFPATGLREVNVHVDVCDWNAGARFVGSRHALHRLVSHLAQRRRGGIGIDPAEPTGMMTHHLVHDLATWRFLERLVAATTKHPAVRWLGGPEVFPDAQLDRGVVTSRP
ncbi:MAG: hypothetical protein QOF78_1839 [Phycisphaerales bacterium]|jgi:hypothetical protein|nr:hypothetical protein [Phycisphaerales bacterium]